MAGQKSAANELHYNCSTNRVQGAVAVAVAHLSEDEEGKEGRGTSVVLATCYVCPSFDNMVD